MALWHEEGQTLVTLVGKGGNQPASCTLRERFLTDKERLATALRLLTGGRLGQLMGAPPKKVMTLLMTEQAPLMTFRTKFTISLTPGMRLSREFEHFFHEI